MTRTGRCSSLFAGKAHPLDDPGKRVLQDGRDDDAGTGSWVTSSSLWRTTISTWAGISCGAWMSGLNNPRRPLEASGTSGQKVVLNGGLNLSVLDGWWAEAYDGLNGFAIGNGRTHSNMHVHDTRDGEDLYRVLRDEVVPLYYQRDRDGLPRGVDQADEADDPHAGLAVQCRPDGDGLRTEVLRAGRERHLERYVASGGRRRPSVFAGLLDAVDDQHFDGRFFRIHLKAQLRLYGLGDDAGGVGWRASIGSAGVAHLLGYVTIDVEEVIETAGETGLVDDGDAKLPGQELGQLTQRSAFAGQAELTGLEAG